jgi:predicted nuclease with TOPRIM domain
VKGEKEELTNKLKELEAEVEAATQMSKEYTALEKRNFDNKIAVYLKTKKFPELSSSFESSANTITSCK